MKERLKTKKLMSAANKCYLVLQVLLSGITEGNPLSFRIMPRMNEGTPENKKAYERSE
jgi:hypothetical protein